MRNNHKRDKKITVMYCKKIKNELGEVSHTLVPLKGCENIWSYYRHLSGKEIAISKLGLAEGQIQVLFEIAWKNNIDESCQIKYNGELYNITNIDDLEGYKKILIIYAYKIN